MADRILTPGAEIRALWIGAGVKRADIPDLARQAGIPLNRIRAMIDGGPFSLDDAERVRGVLRKRLAQQQAAQQQTPGGIDGRP